ncbi:MAG: hypothetical protein HOI89_12040 [Phycisphaerae bacterium]|nr:hypothetical protein [Phycisphaerae bacterium]MBT5658503.1 hypothetical protein [Phycisphaerae bacterium]
MTTLSHLGLLDRRQAMQLAAASLLCSPQLVAAAERPATPRFWTWGLPRGSARTNSQISPLTRIQMQLATPSEAIANITRSIRARLLLTPDIAVTLQGFGMAQGDPQAPQWQTNGTTPLMQAWKDGVSSDSSPAWWITPWYAHGIQACANWMKRFIEAWPLSGPSALPPPSRFFFDTEHWPTVGLSALGVGRTFVAMQQDPRWDTEPIPGFGLPMSTLWDKAGKPPVDPNQTWFAKTNQTWAIWYEGICMTSADAAMDHAAYRLVRAAWPGCACCNYGTSRSFDGVNGRFAVSPGNSWLRYTQRASSDLLSPVCYWANPKNALGVDLAEASLNLAKQVVTAMSKSYGGITPSKIVPWIQLPGVSRKNYGVQEVQTPELTTAMIQMLRGLGVTDFIVWYDSSAGTEADWDSLVNAMSRE